MRHLEPLQGALEAYCRRLLYDDSSLQDVLQSAIANAFRDFHHYAEGSNFRAWIFTYVHLEMMNANRTHNRHRNAELGESITVAEEAWDAALDEPLAGLLLDAPQRILDQCDTELSQAVKSLSPDEQAVLLLHVIGDFKYREVADILGIPMGTVMSRLARSRVRLQKWLVDYGVERGILRREEA